MNVQKRTREEQICRIKNLVDLVVSNENKAESSSSSITSVVPVTSREYLRMLSPEERETLEKDCKCSCTDWSKFYLLLPRHRHEEDSVLENYSSQLRSLISNTRFDGIIILDFISSSTTTDDTFIESLDWLTIPPGIHSNLLVSNSIFKIGMCRVYQNSIVANAFVGSNTFLMKCGHVSTSTDDDNNAFDFFLKPLHITVGAETGGGRELVLTPESTMMDVTQQFSKPPSDQATFGSSPSILQFNIFSDGALIRDTASINNVYLYPRAMIQAACSVHNVIVFPDAKITNSSIVSNVFMQWDCTISDHTKINNAVMMEHSHCGPFSIVESTVMGPDTHASAGEIHASIFGPNTNAHHQSLVIGVLWPLGRGNVGYGANVGSNHTGRLPDQETAAGEGIFWGLSCVVKFPLDMTWAPYSIVAAGIKVPPAQRICMPFSLIVEQQEGGAGINDIIPGWVLQSSPYTLARNDKKYCTRRKAKRHASYTGWKIFRPSIIEMCRSARAMLQSSIEKSIPLQDVPGIGENQLTDRARSVGIQAYQDCIHRYVLQGLLTWVVLVTSDDENGFVNIALQHEFLDGTNQTIPDNTTMSPSPPPVQWPSFPWDPDESSRDEWGYQRQVLLEEFPIEEKSQTMPWLEKLLKKLVSLEQDFAYRVSKCKRRDDVRGAATIPGYGESHVAADDDPVVKEIREKAEKTERMVLDIFNKILTR